MRVAKWIIVALLVGCGAHVTGGEGGAAQEGRGGMGGMDVAPGTLLPADNECRGRSRDECCSGELSPGPCAWLRPVDATVEGGECVKTGPGYDPGDETACGYHFVECPEGYECSAWLRDGCGFQIEPVGALVCVTE